MAMPADIDEIIAKVLKPELKPECERLGIPESFIKGIHSILPKVWEYSSLCQPDERNGEVVGVWIRIDCEIRKVVPALRDLWHEMWHAKDYYEGKKTSEAKAILYSWRRYLGRLLRGTKRAQ